jgi:hypothetical protein
LHGADVGIRAVSTRVGHRIERERLRSDHIKADLIPFPRSVFGRQPRQRSIASSSGFAGSWAILAGTFLAAALSAPGQTFFVTLYVPEITAALDLTPVAIAGVYGTATLVGAALLPFVGMLADWWSASRFLGVIIASLGVSLVALASADGPVTLGLAWAALRCLGQGAVGVGVLAALSRTFVERRGRALALGNLGHPVGECFFPTAIATLVAVTSWRASLLWFAAVYVVVCAPLVATAMRPVPEASRASSGKAGMGRAAGADIVRTSDAARMPVFWVATAVLTAAPVVVTAFLFHLVAFFEGTGLSRLDAPVALMYFAAAQIGATLVTGQQVDRGALRGPLILSCVALIGAPLALPLPLPNAMRVALYGIGLGYATGAAAVAGGALWPAYFGVAAVGRLRALTSGIRNAATAGAPLLVAVVVQRSDLTTARLVLVLLGAIALLLTISLPPSPPRVSRNEPLESSLNV